MIIVQSMIVALILKKINILVNNYDITVHVLIWTLFLYLNYFHYFLLKKTDDAFSIETRMELGEITGPVH